MEPSQSRDRQGAFDTRYSSSFVSLKGAHGLTLLGEHVLHGRRNMLWFPQPSCAAMACPSLAVQFIQPDDSNGGWRKL